MLRALGLLVGIARDCAREQTVPLLSLGDLIEAPELPIASFG